MAMLTVVQLAEVLHCSETKLARLTRAGRIPCLRIGRLVRYELEAVTAVLRVPVMPQTQGQQASRTDTAAESGALPAWALAERRAIHAEARVARLAAREQSAKIR